MNSHDNPCDTQLDLRIIDFKVKSKISDMIRNDIPDRINTKLYPKKLVIVDKEKSRAQALLEIDLPAIVESRIDNELIKGNIESSFNIAVKVPKDIIQLSQKFKNDIFTENPSDLTKIYSSQDLISYLIPNKENYFIVKLPIQIKPDVLNIKKKEIVEEPVDIPYLWILLLIASALLFNHFYSPFGLKIVLKYQDHAKARPFKLSGLFHNAEHKKLNINSSFIQIKRHSNFSKKVDILDDNNVYIGSLTKAGSFLLLNNDQKQKLEWLNQSKIAILKNKHLIDEEL
jgi:hypothetical protein